MPKTYVPLPPAPSGDTWELRGNPCPPSRAVEPDSVHAALLACLDANPSGATLEQCQAAIDKMVLAQGRSKQGEASSTHPDAMGGRKPWCRLPLA